MRPFLISCLAGSVAFAAVCHAQSSATKSDTLWLEVGSREIDGRVYEPHAARVKVRVGDNDRVVNEWTNELTLGDSAGRRVMRWVTKSASYELRQTYDARTLAPLGYHIALTNGGETQVSITGNRVVGTRRVAGDTTTQKIDITLDKPGFFVGASDLVPAAVSLRPGTVMVAPVWHPTWTQSQRRLFSVVGKTTVDVEGTKVESVKVEEYSYPERKLQATWYLLDKSPYMVYGEVPLANGSIQRMTEVEIPRSSK